MDWLFKVINVIHKHNAHDNSARRVWVFLRWDSRLLISVLVCDWLFDFRYARSCIELAGTPGIVGLIIAVPVAMITLSMDIAIVGKHMLGRSNAEFLFYLFLDAKNCDALVGDLEERYKIVR